MTFAVLVQGFITMMILNDTDLGDWNILVIVSTEGGGYFGFRTVCAVPVSKIVFLSGPVSFTMQIQVFGDLKGMSQTLSRLSQLNFPRISKDFL